MISRSLRWKYSSSNDRPRSANASLSVTMISCADHIGKSQEASALRDGCRLGARGTCRYRRCAAEEAGPSSAGVQGRSMVQDRLPASGKPSIAGVRTMTCTGGCPGVESVAAGSAYVSWADPGAGGRASPDVYL